MKRKTNLKNRIFLIVMMLMTMVVSVNAATDCVYYAVLNENDSTLTFKFTEKSSSPNTFFYDIDTYIYSTEVKDDTPVWFNKRNSVKKVVFDSSFSQCRPMNCYGWFRDMRNLREIEGIEYLNTSYVTNMGYMFSGCYNLTTLDVSGFSTSEVSDMSHMFERCSKLKVLDVSGFYTAHVNDMKYMFAFCSALTTLDVSGFYTKRVTNMSNMFFDCRALTTLDVSGFNTYLVSSMTGMFDGCSSLTLLDVSNFDTSNVSSMKNMFQYCSSLTSLDLRGFDTSNVNDMSDMFYGCSVLATIYCNDSWSCERSVLMFVGCMKLRGGIEYTAGKTDVTYANPTTGYFTYKAADERPLCINGTTVTDINEKNLTKIGGVTGTASYDNATKTLTLTEALIYTNVDGTSAIQTNLDSLYIVVNGECMIGSLKLAGITGTSHVVIKGSGKLTVVGVSAVVLLQNLGSLTVADGVQLDIQGHTQNGINGCNALKVSGKDTKLRIFGNTGSCKNLGALTLTDNLAIMDPLGAKYSNGTIVDIDGNEIKYSWVTIEYAEPYGLTLNGTTVTAANNSILSTLPGVTGTASYDNETKTLFLEDASIAELTSTGGYALHTTLDTLRINVTGDCSISSSRGTGIFANSRNVVIGGTGTLDITAGANGIVMNNTSTNTLDIDGKVTVNVTADSYGIQGREYIQRVGLTGTTKTYYRTTLKVGGEGSKLSVNGTAKCFQTLGGFIPADGYEVTAPSRTAYCGTVDGVAYNTFCRLSLSFGKELSDPTTTLTPVAGTAVVIEKPYILGDVNGDGSITMADANMVVNYFLSTDPSSIANFNVAAADVNGDNAITMADANQIVNIFLGQ